MRGNSGLKVQISPELPHIHARFLCNANEQSNHEKVHCRLFAGKFMD